MIQCTGTHRRSSTHLARLIKNSDRNRTIAVPRPCRGPLTRNLGKIHARLARHPTIYPCGIAASPRHTTWPHGRPRPPPLPHPTWHPVTYTPPQTSQSATWRRPRLASPLRRGLPDSTTSTCPLRPRPAGEPGMRPPSSTGPVPGSLRTFGTTCGHTLKARTCASSASACVDTSVAAVPTCSPA
jgi:hypothetical protein